MRPPGLQLEELPPTIGSRDVRSAFAVTLSSGRRSLVRSAMRDPKASALGCTRATSSAAPDLGCGAPVHTSSTTPGCSTPNRAARGQRLLRRTQPGTPRPAIVVVQRAPCCSTPRPGQTSFPGQNAPLTGEG